REQLALQRPLRWLATAIGVENFGLDAGSRQDSREPPDTQRRREKGVFTTVRIVRSDQQHTGRALCIHFFSAPSSTRCRSGLLLARAIGKCRNKCAQSTLALLVGAADKCRPRSR